MFRVYSLYLRTSLGEALIGKRQWYAVIYTDMNADSVRTNMLHVVINFTAIRTITTKPPEYHDIREPKSRAHRLRYVSPWIA